MVNLEMPISLSYGLPTKLMMIKASAHHSIAVEIGERASVSQQIVCQEIGMSH